MAQWEHALERMQERHSSDATMEELFDLGPICHGIVMAWRRREPKDILVGTVVGYQGTDSVVVRLRWRDGWVRVVYVPLTKCIRTVLQK